MPLPTGTITFLFTDIEGSTKLWDEQPGTMRTSLARHDSIIRQAIADSHGQVFKTVGDAFCVVFSVALEAIEAALTAQIAIQLEPWPTDTPIKVRMAVHTGAAEHRDDDYFGPPVNRVARLLMTGHGGQVLLSQSARELILDHLPEGVALLDLGTHLLKDLSQPEHVYQLQHRQIPFEFPPLRSLDNPKLRHNLPPQMSSFIGRENALSEAKALLDKTRLLTLTGTGGCGKTRLSLQVAADLLDGIDDGVWLVEFSFITDPSLVPQTVANVLGLKEEHCQSILEMLVSYLANRKLLLVLDNCEHLLDSCAALADTILRKCPHVRMIATSREAMRIPGETAYPVPSLSTPHAGGQHTPETLAYFESVRLFIDRAQSHQPQFTVTNRNATALASVCSQLDGIPLAIELAAARVRSLTVEDIRDRLDQRFRLLTGGSRTHLPRQQTLRSLIDWSYDLLNDTEKTLYSRLSVFSGGWTLRAAEEVCANEMVEEWEILDLLTSLADKSLILAETTGTNVRYRMLESIRQYAAEQLSSRNEVDRCRGRHLDYYLALAAEGEEHLSGQDESEWLNRFEIEHDNVRAALDWSESSHDTGARGVKLAATFWRFWYMRGHLTEGRDRLRRILAVAVGAEPLERAKALNGAGILAFDQVDYPAARSLYEESLAIRREQNDQTSIAASLGNLGLVAYRQGDYAGAAELHRESLAIQREYGDDRSIANALNNLGNVTHYLGDYATARKLHEESLAIDRKMGNLRGVAISLNNLGLSAHYQGDHARARVLHEESLVIRHELGDRWGIAASMEGLASVDAALGNSIRAAQLWGVAEQLREELGTPLPPNELPVYEEEVSAARAALADDAAFDQAWQEGRAMNVERAIACALEEQDR